MSLTRELPPMERPAPRSTPRASSCEQCGAQLAEDQEWCLECGVARTLIHRAPDWRIPVAIIGTVVAVVLVAFAIALINLSGDANRSTAPSARPTVAPASQPPATH
jgi:hypothetical protein